MTKGFYDSKNVTVLGGGGFIGSFVVEQLVSEGAFVRVVGRSESPRHQPVSSGQVSYKKADLLSLEECVDSIRGSEIVLHLGSVVAGIGHNVSHPASMFTPNVQMAMNVLEACRICNPERVMIASSTCVYSRESIVPTLESEGFMGDPEPANVGYGWAKRTTEKAAAFYSREYGMKMAIVRPENVYGPRDNFDLTTAHVIPALVRRAQEETTELVVWGDGFQTRSFIYVSDIAKAMLMATEKYAVLDPINLGSGKEVTIGEVASKILRIMGKDSVTVVFDKSKPVGQVRKVSDTSKMKEKLGFVPQVGIDEGLRRTVNWYQESTLPGMIR